MLLNMLAQVTPIADPISPWLSILLQGGSFGLLVYIVVVVYPNSAKEARTERETREEVYTKAIDKIENKFDERNNILVAALGIQAESTGILAKDLAVATKEAAVKVAESTSVLAKELAIATKEAAVKVVESTGVLAKELALATKEATMKSAESAIVMAKELTMHMDHAAINTCRYHRNDEKGQ
jgi:hypothetical protein